MEIRPASSSCLAIPVCTQAPMQKIRLATNSDAILLDIPAVTQTGAPYDFIAHYPLPPTWQEATLEANPELFNRLAWEEPSEDIAVPQDGFRPTAHFTAPAGWLNDPNGLFYLNGIWHLFYQCNPFSITWGNMHWGHAISQDLIHWQHLPLTLYPDSLNDGQFGTMFSGSAFIDHDNVSGLGKGTILLFYTKQNPETQQGTQNLATSTDGGKSFQKYSLNPILPSFTPGTCCDRDPNVAYSPEDNCFYMVLYLGDETKRDFALFTSTNLLDWSETDRYSMQNGRECPGILHLQDQVTHQWKWVFTEANGLYRIGTISHGKINMETEARPFVWGNAYAGQFFQNTPHNQNIYLGWLRMHNSPSTHYNGTLTSPMTVTLNNGRLQVKPYAFCGTQMPFSCADHAVINLPEGPLTFDLTIHKVTFNDHAWDIPTELSALNGTLVTDKVTLEFFDQTGLFTLCLSALTNEL